MESDADLNALLELENEQLDEGISERRILIVVVEIIHSGFGRGSDGRIVFFVYYESLCREQQKENTHSEEKREEEKVPENKMIEEVDIDAVDTPMDVPQPKEEYVFKVPPEGRSTLCKLNDVAVYKVYEE